MSRRPTKIISLPARKRNSSGLAMSGPLLAFLIAFFIITLMIGEVVVFRLLGFSGLGLRYFLLPLIALLLVGDLGVRYVQSIHRLPDYNSALRWFWAALFWPGASELQVKDTEPPKNPLAKPNLIRKVGGPGTVMLARDHLALIESLDGGIRVLSEGSHTLGCLDQLKQVVSAKVISGQVEKKSVVTRDGIVIDVTDIRYSYRLDQSGTAPDEAVKRRVYNLSLDAKGETNWDRSVSGMVTSTITGSISDKLVDYLTSSRFRQANPRGEIRRKFEDKSKAQFREIGAELLFYDMGHFGLPKDVNERWAETWQKTWEGKLEILQAQKDAARIKFQRAYQRGRTEAQVDLLIKVMKALDRLEGGYNAIPGGSANVFVTGITQLLDALGKDAMGDDVVEGDFK